MSESAPTPVPGREAPVAISVVVPVYNGAATIAKTLAALAAQEFDGAFETIVVDGGSDDGTLEILREASDHVIVLHNPQREPASSRNLGARHARAEILAFTDADCAPDAGWLTGAVRAIAGFDIVQGKVVPESAAGPFDRTLGVASEYGLYETANLIVRRETFERTGGFEPMPGLELPGGTHFGEDAWFVWRAKRLGARTAFADGAVVRHAVFHRGGRAFLKEVLRRRHFARLVALIPELRTTYLHRRYFLSPTSARFDLAVAGIAVALAGRHRAGLLVVLPYAAAAATGLGSYPARDRARFFAGRVAADAVTFAALAAASARTRTVVL